MGRKKVERNISYDDARGKYYVNLDYGLDPKTKKQVKKTKTFRTLKEARAALRKHETSRDDGKLVLPKDLRMGRWLQEWMDTVVKPNRAETTVYGYQNMIENHIVPMLGDIPLQKLTVNELQRYYAHKMQKDELSPNTVRKHHDLINSALKVAVKQDLLAVNPAEKVTPPKKIEADIQFYTAEQLKTLLELVSGHRLEILVKLAGYLGLRREEIMALKWSNVDFEQRVIVISAARTSAGSKIVEKTTKTAASRRRLYMPEELTAVLEEHKRKQEVYQAVLGDNYCEEGYVFSHEDGRPFRPNYVSELFTAFIKENNLPAITLHGLRHTFATLGNFSGLTMYDIGKALGHSTTATTSKIYTHVIDQSHQSTIEKIADTLKSTAEQE